MEKDVAPDLIKDILIEFNKKIKADTEIQSLLKKLSDVGVTHKDSHLYSHKLGKLLAKSFKEIIDYEKLPDGRMYFNIADRLVRQTYGQGYELVESYATKVQEILNAETGLRIKAVQSKINEDKLVGIIDRLSDAEEYKDIAWILDEPTVNFMDSVVDDFIMAQVEFHGKLGLKPKIKRMVLRPCCSWCEEKEGTYDYPVPIEIYQRHRHCDCVVEYHPKDGRGIQNTDTKNWR